MQSNTLSNLNKRKTYKRKNFNIAKDTVYKNQRIIVDTKVINKH